MRDSWEHLQPDPKAGESATSCAVPLPKTFCVVPLPKIPHSKDLSSYRLVALTSHLMKTLERLVLTHLRTLVSPSMDPLQFIFQHGIGVDDAAIFLLHRALSHLEKPGSTVRIKFFDFLISVLSTQYNVCS